MRSPAKGRPATPAELERHGNKGALASSSVRTAAPKFDKLSNHLKTETQLRAAPHLTSGQCAKCQPGFCTGAGFQEGWAE